MAGSGGSRDPVSVIVVGVDGSQEAHAAVAFAAELAAQLGARVVAVHAVGLLEHLRGDPAGTHLLPLVAEWSHALDVLPGDRVRRRAVNGDPVGALRRAVAEEGAGLLVVGSRGAGSRPPTTLGSTSHQLAWQCPCPVVIVPWGAGET